MNLVRASEQAGRVCPPQLKHKNGVQYACPALDAFPFKKGRARFTAIFKHIDLHVVVEQDFQKWLGRLSS